MSFHRRTRMKRGFTLVEMLAAATVLVILLGILVAVMNSVSKTVRSGGSKIDSFASARAGFNLLTQKLSQSTLNTYWDYDNPQNPTVYRRQSDLQFLILQNTQKPGYGQEVYFAAPQSYSNQPAIRTTEGLLNACGFFISYGGDKNFRPVSETGPERFRYRLMQALQPTERFSAYATGTLPAKPTETQWTEYWTTHSWINEISNVSGTNYVTPVADNIIALIIWPRVSKAEDSAGTSLSENYSYDSKKGQFDTPLQKNTANLLPPTLQVTLIMISEASAVRLNMQSTAPAQIESALAGRFTNVTSYKTDLERVGQALADLKIDYNIFTTTIPLRESKWSQETVASSTP